MSGILNKITDNAIGVANSGISIAKNAVVTGRETIFDNFSPCRINREALNELVNFIITKSDKLDEYNEMIKKLKDVTVKCNAEIDKIITEYEEVFKKLKAAIVLNNILKNGVNDDGVSYSFNGEKYYFTDGYGKYIEATPEFYNSLNELVLLRNNKSITELHKYVNKVINLSTILEIFSPTKQKIHDLFTDILNIKPDKLDKLYNEIINLSDNDKKTQKEEAAGQAGGKRKTKGKSKKVAKKPVVSQKKQSIYKEILGKQMKIYKMPDSRKEYVKYKGDLHLITDYKDLMKQKANAKPKAKPKK